MRRIDIQCGEKERLDQSPVDRPLASDDFADRLSRRRQEQRRHRRIVERTRSRYAPAGIEDPKRNAAVVEAQHPAFAARQVDEGEFSGRGTGQPMFGADAAQIFERRAIAREDQVIAVVDHHAERSVVIGPAAAAGERGCLVQHDASAASGKPHRRGKAGKSGADDMNRRSHWQVCITRDCAAR